MDRIDFDRGVIAPRLPDITYIRTQEGFTYLKALDTYSRGALFARRSSLSWRSASTRGISAASSDLWTEGSSDKAGACGIDALRRGGSEGAADSPAPSRRMR